jgi:O-antigen/teichoic acid export membrane protein
MDGDGTALSEFKTTVSSLASNETGWLGRLRGWLAARLPARVAAWLADGGERAKAQRMAGTAFVIRVMSAGILFITQVLLARWMGRFEFGIYVCAWSWVSFLGMLTPLGLAYSSQRFIPEYRTLGDHARLAGFVRGVRLLCFGLGIVAGLLLAATVFVLDGHIPAYYVVPFLLTSVALPIFAVSAAQDTMSRAFDWVLLALLPGYLVHPTLVFLAMGALYLTGAPITAVAGLIAAVGALWAVVLIQLAFLARRFGRALPKVKRRYDVRTWFATALPIFLVDSFFILLTYVDTLVLQLFVTPDDVAVYFAASKTLALVAFVYYAVSSTSAHRFSALHFAGEHDKLARLVADTVRWTFWPSLALALVLIALGRFILALFGPDFVHGYPLLCVLALGLVARASIGPSERLLNMVGRQTTCAFVYATAFATNLVLCLTLIPPFGLIGAAYATAIAILVESTLLFVAVRKKLGINVFVFARR